MSKLILFLTLGVLSVAAVDRRLPRKFPPVAPAIERLPPVALRPNPPSPAEVKANRARLQAMWAYRVEQKKLMQVLGLAITNGMDTAAIAEKTTAVKNKTLVTEKEITVDFSITQKAKTMTENIIVGVANQIKGATK